MGTVAAQIIIAPVLGTSEITIFFYIWYKNILLWYDFYIIDCSYPEI